MAKGNPAAALPGIAGLSTGVWEKDIIDPDVLDRA